MSTINNIIAPANRLGDTKEYYFSRKLKEIAAMRNEGKDIINLGIGSPDLPPHPDVIQALIDAASQTNNHGYQSYSGIPELRAAFARWYQHCYFVSLDPETEVLPLLGSKEGIMHISMAFLNPGDEVLIPDPGYPTYKSATTLAGGQPRYYALNEENNWLPDLEKLESDGLERVKIMWVNYPHMPTGTQAPAGFYQRLIAFAQRNNILLINDNPYAFILTEKPESILSVPGAKSCAMELTSLSKAHNMAGWRVGALLGQKELLNTVLRFKSNMDSGSFKGIQLAAVKALELDRSWYDQLNDTYRKRREIVYRILDELGCSYATDQAGLFVWASCPVGKTAYEISDAVLYENNIFITPGGIFGSQGEHYVRVSLCSPEDRLKAALNRLKK